MYFPDPVIFELPVRPRVAKFIHVKLTDHLGQRHPMLVHPQAQGPGLFLWALCQSEKVALHTRYLPRPGSAQRGPGLRQIQPEDYTAVIGLGIYEFHYTRHQYLLNYSELTVFSGMVDHMIQNELVQFIEAEPESSPISRIKRFCDHYDFSEDDFREQSLRQMYWRYRKGIGSFNFSREMARNFSFVPMPVAA